MINEKKLKKELQKRFDAFVRKCGMAYSTDREKDDAEQLKWIHQLSEEKKK